ncbi:MAG: response regulator transcription factor [Candidatus Gracilibacteria bacterium]|nr:response regulator transcription factor [Candidatus Gracilibacteria bacterium]
MHISIIDDEKILTNKISKKLKLNGYGVSEFYSFKEFMINGTLSLISDLYIIDISLGDGNGFDIINFLRKTKGLNTPIIIISGFGDTQNIIFGLNLGADDYITKPFYPEELIARIKAILRRPSKIEEKNNLVYNNIVLNNFTKELKIDGKKINLNKKEILIIELFIKNKGKLIPKESFIKTIWGVQNNLDISENTLNATLSKLRRKVGNNFPLQTKYNMGYILK